MFSLFWLSRTKMEVEGDKSADVLEGPPGGPAEVPKAEQNEGGNVCMIHISPPAKPKPESETGTEDEKNKKDEKDEKDQKDQGQDEKEEVFNCTLFCCYIPFCMREKRHRNPNSLEFSDFITFSLRICLYVFIFITCTYVYHTIREGPFEIEPSFPPFEPTAFMSPGCMNSTGNTLILNFGCDPAHSIDSTTYNFGCSIESTPYTKFYAEEYGAAAYIVFTASACAIWIIPYWLFFLPLLFFVGFLRLGYQNLVVGKNMFMWCLLRNGSVDIWGDVHLSEFPYQYHSSITQPACKITFENPIDRNNVLNIIRDYQCSDMWYDSRSAFVPILPSPHAYEKYDEFQQKLRFLLDLCFYAVWLSFLIVDIHPIKLLFTKPWKKICICSCRP